MRLDWRSVRLLFASRVFGLGNSNTILYLSNIPSASVVVALRFQYLGRLYKDGLFCREWRRNRGLKYSFEVQKIFNNSEGGTYGSSSHEYQTYHRSYQSV